MLSMALLMVAPAGMPDRSNFIQARSLPNVPPFALCTYMPVAVPELVVGLPEATWASAAGVIV